MARSDLIGSISQVILLTVFFLAGAMKILNALGFAPAGYAKHAAEVFPIFGKSWVVAATHIPHQTFFVLAGLLEAGGALTLFWRPKIAASILLFAVAAIELITRTAPGFVSPMCSNPPSASCAISLAFHLVFAALAGLVLRFGTPLCTQVVDAIAHFRGYRGRSPRATKNPYATRNRAKKD